MQEKGRREREIGSGNVAEKDEEKKGQDGGELRRRGTETGREKWGVVGRRVRR